eukprot:836069-Pelagomonas_calceolata.AAC.1
MESCTKLLTGKKVGRCQVSQLKNCKAARYLAWSTSKFAAIQDDQCNQRMRLHPLPSTLPVTGTPVALKHMKNVFR